MRISLLLFSLAISNLVCCQLLTLNKGHIWARYSLGKVDSARYSNYSIAGEYLVNDYLGLNYNLDFTDRSDRISQLHFPIGPVVGPPVFALGIVALITQGSDGGTDEEEVDDDDGDSDFNLGIGGILLGLAIMALPDGVSLHLPATPRLDISPYANVLGIDVVRNRNTDTRRIKYALSFGAKTTYIFPNNMTLSGFMETRKVAGMGWGLGGGIGIGYAFSRREVTPDN